MKTARFAIAVTAAALVLAFAGCSQSKTDNSSMGAMGEKGDCASSCSTSKSSCSATKDKASMGAVSEKKSGCCSSKTSCTEKKN